MQPEGSSPAPKITTGERTRSHRFRLIVRRLRSGSFDGPMDAVAQILRGLGHTLEDGGDVIPSGEDDVVFVYGNVNWFPKLRQWLLKEAREPKPLVAIWHCEPLPPSAQSKLPKPRLHFRELVKVAIRDNRATDPYTNFRLLRRLHRRRAIDLLFVSTQGRQEFLEEHEIPSHWIPMGYCHVHGQPLDRTRDIDVLFLGAPEVPRRRRILQQLQQQGVNVTALGDWKNPAYWGKERTALLNRAKILLNFGRQAGEMSGFRLIIGMANKSLVISEPIYRPAPFRAGEHFLSAPVDQIPGLVRQYLEDEPARRQIVEAAYEYLLREATLERSVQRILTLIEPRL